jgi:hypothetical protein
MTVGPSFSSGLVCFGVGGAADRFPIELDADAGCLIQLDPAVVDGDRVADQSLEILDVFAQREVLGRHAARGRRSELGMNVRMPVRRHRDRVSSGKIGDWPPAGVACR